MPVTCPQCSHVNPDSSTFCVSCGNRMQQTGQYNPTAISSSLPTYLSSASNQPAQPSNSPSTGPSYSPSAPSLPSFPPGSNTSPSAPPYPSTNYPPAGQQWPPTFQPPPPPGPQMGTAQGLGSIRRAFAGYGTLIMHHSWLLNGDSVHAGAVFTAIRDKVAQRNVARLSAHAGTLTERGILMEEREYLIEHRGVATVFVYVAPAGQDLYISRATTVLPAISNIRVAILGLLFLIMFIGFLQSPATFAYAGIAGGFTFGTVIALICYLLSYPILLFFIILLIRSFISWLVDKDFWSILRPNFLNDFNLDDIAILEHLTDDVAHSAVEQVGLDASKITPPPFGYQHSRKIRVV